MNQFDLTGFTGRAMTGDGLWMQLAWMVVSRTILSRWWFPVRAGLRCFACSCRHRPRRGLPSWSHRPLAVEASRRRRKLDRGRDVASQSGTHHDRCEHLYLSRSHALHR